MPLLPPVDVIAIDVLGTLVDEPGALRAAIASAAPDLDAAAIEIARAAWERRVGTEQERIDRGERDHADADALAAETAAHIAPTLGVTDPAVVATLARPDRLLQPWPDSAQGIDLLERRVPVYGLSNATTATLDGLADRAGFRWHGAFSASAASAYKPAPSVYALVSDATGVPPQRVLMVAAHAWDLRGAQAVGMRTAYVARPGGDPPRADDRFDGAFRTLAELADVLGER
ncbi:haloacid dehalogenase type II [Microbacterium sp. NPDC058345]|uniref:haloacid dehalogenase type II n=1 Tax=Microbacterium sp. NPDC058345 TaxID=3346455 RepID=UPI00364D76A2